MSSSFRLHSVRVLEQDGGFGDAVDVVVGDGVIEQVAERTQARADRPTLDGAGLWLMPGIVDCHTHAGMSSVDTLANLRTPFSLRTLQTAANLRATLAAGVTLARDAGGLDAGLREAIRAGLTAGPELKLSIVLLSQTGGHSDGFLAGPGIESSVEYFMPDYPGRPQFLVDGVDEMRRAVRQVLRAGGDWIKVCTTGGVFGGLEAAGTPQLSVEEVRVAVSEAAKRGRGVMADALGGAGVDVALDAGVKSIEHGLLINEEQAARMAADGCFLVPTLSIYADVAARVRATPEAFPAVVVESALALDTRLGEGVAIALEAGVPIALGSDLATDHGTNLKEIGHLHRAGLSVEQTLLAATSVGAGLLGEGERRGRIAPGYVFDALLLDQDPSDLTLFDRPGAVAEVFQAGKPVLGHPRVAGS